MPRSSREKSIETRANIVEAAYRLFVDQGYNATSMREISQYAGVTIGAIYNHFETKEAIWVEVLQQKHPYHEVIPVLLSAEGETIAEVMRSAAGLFIGELNKRPDLFNLLFIEIVEFKAAHVPVLLHSILPNLAPLQQLLQEKSGCLRDVPDYLIFRSFIGYFLFFYISGKFVSDLPEISNDAAMLDQFVNLYLKGILDDSDPSRKGQA
jgi:AcrR family transcriptional regulator